MPALQFQVIQLIGHFLHLHYFPTGQVMSLSVVLTKWVYQQLSPMYFMLEKTPLRRRFQELIPSEQPTQHGAMPQNPAAMI
ncbi:MAG: hypothetical protein DDT19_01585 [Syntrophomonadaceae bacterium]|nr:hypothetical protein [Bacillota bacterium]